MSKHTPGPWQLCHHLESLEHDKGCPCGKRGDIWGGDGNHIVCEIGNDESIPLASQRYPREVELANSRLIAAAPDLYEALKAMSHANSNSAAVRARLLCRAALAKAEGVDPANGTVSADASPASSSVKVTPEPPQSS